MDMCGNGLDSGAIAEGVWEYVNSLVKTYHSLETRGEQETCQYQVRFDCGFWGKIFLVKWENRSILSYFVKFTYAK